MALNELADAAAADCDVALVLVDLTREELGPGGAGRAAANAWPQPRTRRPCWSATKADLAKPLRQLPGPRPASRADPRPPCSISAQHGPGHPGDLLDALTGTASCPRRPPLYPEDQLSDRPLRFLVAELVREAAFEVAGPGGNSLLDGGRGAGVRRRADRGPDAHPGQPDASSERTSEADRRSGRAGSVIKQHRYTGSQGDQRSSLGQRVHLELWVKVEPKWAKRPNRLKSLGYSLTLQSASDACLTGTCQRWVRVALDSARGSPPARSCVLQPAGRWIRTPSAARREKCKLPETTARSKELGVACPPVATASAAQAGRESYSRSRSLETRGRARRQRDHGLRKRGALHAGRPPCDFPRQDQGQGRGGAGRGHQAGALPHRRLARASVGVL